MPHVHTYCLFAAIFLPDATLSRLRMLAKEKRRSGFKPKSRIRCAIRLFLPAVTPFGAPKVSVDFRAQDRERY